MISVLFKNLKYQTLTFICLSLAVGLVVAFGPRLLGGRVGLLPLFRFNCEVISWREDSNGCILSILLLCGNSKIHVINIYAPTNLSGRKAFFFPADFWEIGGDFNCYEHKMDKLGGNISIADYLTDFRSSFGLVSSLGLILTFLLVRVLINFLSLKVSEVICFNLQFRRVVYPIMISLIYIFN